MTQSLVFNSIFTTEANPMSTEQTEQTEKLSINYYTGIKFTPNLEIIADHEDLMPSYSHSGDAGMDLKSEISGVIDPHTIAKLSTGLKVAIPEGYVGLVVPRSSLGSKGITVANSPGIIDSGYRGDLKVALINHTDDDWLYRMGDRIAQLLIVPVATARIERVLEFSNADTSRGEGGFGSTGTN